VDELGRSTGLERPRMNTEEFLSRSSELLGKSWGCEMRRESPEFREVYEKLDESLKTTHKKKKRYPNKNC